MLNISFSHFFVSLVSQKCRNFHVENDLRHVNNRLFPSKCQALTMTYGRVGEGLRLRLNPHNNRQFLLLQLSLANQRHKPHLATAYRQHCLP
jgi:hypothetical protein